MLLVLSVFLHFYQCFDGIISVFTMFYILTFSISCGISNILYVLVGIYFTEIVSSLAVSFIYSTFNYHNGTAEQAAAQNLFKRIITLKLAKTITNW